MSGSRFHRWCARRLLGITQPGRRRAAAGRRPWSRPSTSRCTRRWRSCCCSTSRRSCMKRELADIPLWGWVARRYGIIPVDRDGGAAALRRMMRAAEAAIAEGRPIVIFPEGHAGRAGRAAAAPVGLRRPLPRAEAAGRAGRARQRPAVAARARFVKRPGIVTFRFARADPARPAARRDRSRRSTRRSTRWSRRDDA